jgi:two-component system response regulator FixJ
MPTIHVIDDNFDVREALSSLLEDSGRPARAYPSAEDFLSQVDNEIRGCVIADLRMPGMSGLTLMGEIEDRRLGLPVIIMTGDRCDSSVARVKKRGAFDFVVKPFSTEALFAVVDAALDFSRGQREEVAASPAKVACGSVNMR